MKITKSFNSLYNTKSQNDIPFNNENMQNYFKTEMENISFDIQNVIFRMNKLCEAYKHIYEK